MSRQSLSYGIVWLVALLTATVGCQPQKPFYFLDDGDFSHYLDVATDIDVPDLEVQSLDEVNGTLPPLTLDNAEPDSFEDLTLEEAVRNALENAKVMRNLGGVAFTTAGPQGIPSSLLDNPGGASTIWDPALAESDPRFGVEGALAAFDTRLTTSVFWEKNDTPRNSGAPGTVFEDAFPSVLQQDLGTFQAQLSKTNATGGTTSITHNVRYDQSNGGFRLFPSDWSTNIEMQVRQPFMQGAGTQYNLIAGPGAIPGFNSGVMIARLRVDTSLNDFEVGVRSLIRSVEEAYWNLYYAYRYLDTIRAGRDSGLQTWREVEALTRIGARRGGAQEEAQARQQLWVFQAELEKAQSSLFKNERLLRYTMGLSPADGRLFRPSDKPTTAKVTFDWYEVHGEALTRSIELRKQRWGVKQRQLELIAAKNYLLPRLDGVARYRWLGLGDDMVDSSNNSSNAYGSMTDGDFQEWQLGLELNIPLGFRKEMAGVRNAQLALARSRSVLQEQEVELIHQLQDAINELITNYTVAQTYFNGMVAAEKDLEAAKAKREAEIEGATLTLVLDAQRRLAEVERSYYRSLVDYNLAITMVHFRKGSLLEYNGVYLAEGPWTDKAYFDAERRAQKRDAGFYLDYGFTRPKVISRGAYGQHAGRDDVIFESGMDLPVEPTPELLPTPAPVPLDSLPADPILPGNADQSNKRTSQSAEKGPKLSGKVNAKAGWAKSLSPGKGRYDLAKHMDILATGSLSASAEPAGRVSPVKQAGYVRSKPATATGSQNTGNWRGSASSGKANENRKSSAPAKTNSSSSGWKRAKR